MSNAVLTTTIGSFLKMISEATVGGTVTNYSKRFTLTGMTGSFSQAVLDGLKNVKGTDGPPTQNQVTGQNNANPAADGSYTIPYTLQTGPTRYAPMQPLPPSKITAKQTKRLFPTSAVTFAKTWLPPASIMTTLTQSATYSVNSRANDVRNPTPFIFLDTSSASFHDIACNDTDTSLLIGIPCITTY